MANVIIVENFSIYPPNPGAQSTPLGRGFLVDENSEKVVSSEVDACLCHVWDKESGTVLRELQDILGSSDLTLTDDTDSTLFEWFGQAEDTSMVDRTNETEVRRVEFHFLYGTAAASGTAATPFTTVVGDRTVSVNIVGHGMTAGSNHNIFFADAFEIGGLVLNGEYNVQGDDIIDANNFTFEAKCEATASAGPAGGSAVRWWTNAKSTIHYHEFAVTRIGPACS